MKFCIKGNHFKELAAFSKLTKAKDGLQSKCKECAKAQHLANRENARKGMQQYYQNNKVKLDIINNQWAKDNPIRSKKIKAKYVKNNLPKCAAKCAKRYADKLQATPKWLTSLHFQQIQIFYDSASALTKEFGVPMEVDHIIPLKGKNVSGLHVPWNLQVLFMHENRQKSNKTLQIR